jgi:hypothetical protein
MRARACAEPLRARAKLRAAARNRPRERRAAPPRAPPALHALQVVRQALHVACGARRFRLRIFRANAHCRKGCGSPGTHGDATRAAPPRGLACDRHKRAPAGEARTAMRRREREGRGTGALGVLPLIPLVQHRAPQPSRVRAAVHSFARPVACGLRLAAFIKPARTACRRSVAGRAQGVSDARQAAMSRAARAAAACAAHRRARSGQRPRRRRGAGSLKPPASRTARLPAAPRTRDAPCDADSGHPAACVRPAACDAARRKIALPRHSRHVTGVQWHLSACIHMARRYYVCSRHGRGAGRHGRG